MPSCQYGASYDEQTLHQYRLSISFSLSVQLYPASHITRPRVHSPDFRAQNAAKSKAFSAVGRTAWLTAINLVPAGGLGCSVPGGTVHCDAVAALRTHKRNKPKSNQRP
eukprot:544357-Rhodomonas_salina.1